MAASLRLRGRSRIQQLVRRRNLRSLRLMDIPERGLPRKILQMVTNHRNLGANEFQEKIHLSNPETRISRAKIPKLMLLRTLKINPDTSLSPRNKRELRMTSRMRRLTTFQPSVVPMRRY